MLNVPVKYFTTFNKSSNINVQFLIRGNAAAIFANQDTIASIWEDIVVLYQYLPSLSQQFAAMIPKFAHKQQ